MNVKWLLADKLIHVIPPFSKGGFSKKKLIHVTSKKKKVDPVPFVRGTNNLFTTLVLLLFEKF